MLLFRDVTYFPLTWRFAVDEFGWEYEYDQATGLTISNPSAPFKPTEEWDGDKDYWGSLMGTGSLKIACMFFVSTAYTPLPTPSISWCNMTGHDIRILPDNFCWEYRLYKMIGSREEMVYRKAIPFYYGEIPTRYYVRYNINDNYWNGNFSTGDYCAKLVHPEEYLYQIIDTGEIVSTPTEESGADLITFSGTFTVG